MNLWFDFLHNCIAHPAMFVFGYFEWPEKFHDWTAARAWPEGEEAP